MKKLSQALRFGLLVLIFCFKFVDQLSNEFCFEWKWDWFNRIFMQLIAIFSGWCKNYIKPSQIFFHKNFLKIFTGCFCSLSFLYLTKKKSASESIFIKKLKTDEISAKIVNKVIKNFCKVDPRWMKVKFFIRNLDFHKLLQILWNSSKRLMEPRQTIRQEYRAFLAAIITGEQYCKVWKYSEEKQTLPVVASSKSCKFVNS